LKSFVLVGSVDKLLGIEGTNQLNNFGSTQLKADPAEKTRKKKKKIPTEEANQLRVVAS